MKKLIGALALVALPVFAAGGEVVLKTISRPIQPAMVQKGPISAPKVPVTSPSAAFPTDAQCGQLLPIKGPLSFGPGEVLEYDLDALGAKAGRMTMRPLNVRDNQLPIEVSVETNTFFSKVRKVKGTGTSTVNARTLEPLRYYEDATENDSHRVADVTFRQRERNAHLTSTIDGQRGDWDFSLANHTLDVAGAIFYVRQMPLKDGQSVCFDAYGIRRIWRVWGTVKKEHVSLPVGEFESFHLEGQAAPLNQIDARREIHVWISDDARRLPLAALGAIDLGAVRATLTAFTRPGDKGAKAETKANIKW